VQVGPDALLGEPGQGFVMIMQSFQWERICMALGAVAGAAASLERVSSWLDVPDERWWELAQRLAAARALAYATLTAVVAGRDVVPAVSAAKLLACDLAVDAADLLLAQATRVSDAEATRAERALRDARLGPVGGGAREVMAELVARSLPLA
jgi:acyl-CoA dehydrogenase